MKHINKSTVAAISALALTILTGVLKSILIDLLIELIKVIIMGW